MHISNFGNTPALKVISKTKIMYFQSLSDEKDVYADMFNNFTHEETSDNLADLMPK